ncbi:hypothetical protein [Archangium primigenium]|uniref:hypothetical protein n=1 Tax=[Archangium] primigenium TaxID=2792470 RepID=UPI00195EFEB6|nr:hypothetical protein [Archangium primigenium]MBM7112382.1 hypothetical protein [Archangium primigenium]
MSTLKSLARLTTLFLSFSAPSTVLAGTCDDGTGESLSIQLHPAPGKALMQTPYRASIKVSGGPVHQVEIDTGSAAIILPKTLIGPDATLLSSGQSYGYVSSGNGYLGDWMLAKVEVALDQSKGGPATATSSEPIPVFGVTHTCKGKPTPERTHCTALDEKPGHLGMMGIGYRPFTVPGQTARALPSTNLFMNLGRQTPGYVITSRSIQVGLNRENTQGFKTLPLVASANGQLAPRTCIRYATEEGKTKELCGASLLMDTGINHFYLTMPAKYCPAKSLDGRAPKGAGFTLSAPDSKNPVLAFSFKVGDPASSPMLPEYVNCVTEPGTPSTPPSSDSFHVNTGRTVLAGMDYLYRASDDPACHVIGFRPTTAR